MAGLHDGRRETVFRSFNPSPANPPPLPLPPYRYAVWRYPVRSVQEHAGFWPPRPEASPAAALEAASRATTTVPHQHRAAMPGDAVRRCRHWGSGPVRTWRSLARLRLAPNSGSGTGQLPDQRSNRPAGRHAMSARDCPAWCADVDGRQSWQVAAPTRGRQYQAQLRPC